MSGIGYVLVTTTRKSDEKINLRSRKYRIVIDELFLKQVQPSFKNANIVALPNTTVAFL